jgi:hypothetical protein
MYVFMCVFMYTQLAQPGGHLHTQNKTQTLNTHTHAHAHAQVMQPGGDWMYATVVTIENARFGVMCDNGVWMPGVPIEQVRSVRGLPRAGSRGSRHGFELQDFMFERGLDARSMEHHALLTGGRPQADLRRQYSCFEVGDINRDGYTAPKNRLDVSSEHTSLPPLPVVAPSHDTMSPTTIQVSFRLASAPAGEMYKVKSAAQLKTLLDGSAGNVAGILFIDASSRPPAGQSWPRHIHSASTMVKVRLMLREWFKLTYAYALCFFFL